jgi:hypothetical protein
MPPVVSADTGNIIGTAGAQRITGELASKAIPTHPTNGSWGRKASIKQFLIKMFIVNRLAT